MLIIAVFEEAYLLQKRMRNTPGPATRLVLVITVQRPPPGGQDVEGTSNVRIVAAAGSSNVTSTVRDGTRLVRVV